MDLAIKYNKADDAQAAYANVKKAITPETIAKFKVKADLSYKENEQISASGKGFDLYFDFKPDEVQVTLKLGLLFKAFKGTILEGVEKQLSRVV